MKFKFFLMLSLALFFTACARSYYYAPGKEEQYAFRVNEGESKEVSNPSGNLTRVYLYRDSTIYPISGLLFWVGGLIPYAVFYDVGEFNKRIVNHDPQRMVFYSYNYISVPSVPGEYTYKDIDIKQGEAVTFRTDSPSRKLVAFYPKPNQIYCVQTSTRRGFIMESATMELVDKQTCLEEIKGLKFQGQ